MDRVWKASHLSVLMNFLQENSENVNAVCDAIVQTVCKLEDMRKYKTDIFTGLVHREPSDVVGALEQVKRARSTM